MFLLDTNVVSELRKAKTNKCDKHVLGWAESVDTYSLYISVISILEIETGVLSMERKDGKQGAILRAWLNSHIMPAFEGRILPVDTAVAQACAKLHVPDPKPDRDAIIAATALTHDMIIVTRNIGDFASTGAALLNPWEY